ncbi:hypothetical protein [Sphingomonas faeni]
MDKEIANERIERAIDNVFAALDAATHHLLEAARYWEEMRAGGRK